MMYGYVKVFNRHCALCSGDFGPFVVAGCNASSFRFWFRMDRGGGSCNGTLPARLTALDEVIRASFFMISSGDYNLVTSLW